MNYICHSRYVSFKCAFSGLKRLLRETNFRIHIIITVITIVAGIFCSLSSIEWCAIVICFGMVLTAEGLNTAVEILADRVCSARDECIRLAKDVAAGAVLLAAVAAVVVGVVIFADKVCLIVLK